MRSFKRVAVTALVCLLYVQVVCWVFPRVGPSRGDDGDPGRRRGRQDGQRPRRGKSYGEE